MPACKFRLFRYTLVLFHSGVAIYVCTRLWTLVARTIGVSGSLCRTKKTPPSTHLLQDRRKMNSLLESLCDALNGRGMGCCQCTERGDARVATLQPTDTIPNNTWAVYQEIQEHMQLKTKEQKERLTTS